MAANPAEEVSALYLPDFGGDEKRGIIQLSPPRFSPCQPCAECWQRQKFGQTLERVGESPEHVGQ